MTHSLFSSALRNASIEAASEPEKTTLKSRPRLATIASSNCTYDGSAPRNWPLPSDSDVSNSEAYLLRLL